MIGRKVLATKFPKCRIEVPDVDDIAGGIANLNTVADLVGAPNENENPADKALHRSLDCQTDDDRPNPKSRQRRVPIDE